jgi:hypothetical protein
MILYINDPTGLTMRFMLMQLFGWSPMTFHSVWNAGNCQMYVLKKDLTKPGPSPYVLDKERGDVPRSSINVEVQVKQRGQRSSGDDTGGVGGDGGDGDTADETIVTKSLTLENYLNVPPPRTTQFNCIQHMLAEQYPDEIQNANDIVRIRFMPFVAVQQQGCGVVECKPASSSSSSSSSSLTSSTAAAAAKSSSSATTSWIVSSTSRDTNGNVSSSVASALYETSKESPSSSSVQWAKREQSLRWSYFRVPGDNDEKKSS